MDRPVEAAFSSRGAVRAARTLALAGALLLTGVPSALAGSPTLPGDGGALPSTARVGRGGFRADLWRPGMFTTQHGSTWCVAASIQAEIDLATGQRDHSTRSQRRYLRYAQLHGLRWNEPITLHDDGADPVGWANALDHFTTGVDYRLVGRRRSITALRMAAIQLRRTGWPVGLVVQGGNHAWTMTGFTATRDPAGGAPWRLTGIYVLGPWWPRPAHHGYDPAPHAWLSVRTMDRRLTPVHDEVYRAAWEGRHIVILPTLPPGASPTGRLRIVGASPG